MRVRLATAALLLALGAAPAAAQAQTEQSPRPSDVVEELNEFIAEEEQSAAEAPELPSQGDLQMLAAMDSSTAAVYIDALRELYRYQLTGFQHRTRVFRWQFYSSIVIFCIVHLLVLAGLYFSWLQFRKGWEGLDSRVEISPTGIKVQSSVLGVIILVVSLGFFYLYLVYVYPISEII